MSLFSSSTPAQAQTVFLSLLLYGVSVNCHSAEDIPLFDKFRKFEQIYEPSGVQQLPDGRFVVVEDESVHPMGVFSLLPDGQVSELPLYRGSLTSWLSPNRVLSSLEDLEAVAMDEQGRIYAITSHSRKANGKRADKREQLVRFTLDGEQIVDFQAVRNLRKKISRQHDALKDAARVRDVKEEGGFNIEGLSFDADKQKLLIGLRSPVAGSNAIIVILENPRAVFENDEKPRISDQLIELDLAGGGIRAMCYDPHLGGFLIISRKPGKSFKLWLWSGKTDEPPGRLRTPDIKNLRRAEGVTPVLMNGRPAGILIVSDDGIGLKRKPGHYIFLRYEQLASK
ncbi:MAG: DUF3616 domain-containing protein [Thiotrichales bacterium]|nr:MAG: DUF3616 domain-containing protein [Thiotrichales bacterium]